MVRVVILTACLPVALSLFGLIPPGPGMRLAVSESVPEVVALVVLSATAAIVAHYVRFPGGLIFGAMLASGILHGSGLIHAGMPWWIVAAVMISLGSLSGARFANTELRLLARHCVAALGSFSVAVAIVAVFAGASAWLLKLQLSDIVVSFSPGALDAMMILALALHLDPIFVGAHHVARFLLISLSLPVFVRLYGQTPLPPAPKVPDKRPVQED
jgi:membrane AbrB-like protein